MKGKGKINNDFDELDLALGNPNMVDVFPDGKVRNLSFVPMSKFSEFMKNVNSIDYKNLWINFMNEDMQKSLIRVLELSFKDDSIDELLEQISAENYSDIINKILKINGIELKTDDGAGDSKAKKE